MGELEKIYYEYQNLIQGGDGEEVKKSCAALYELFDKQGLTITEYEDFLAAYACANEKQGFINGFQYAMRIALECMNTKTA